MNGFDEEFLRGAIESRLKELANLELERMKPLIMEHLKKSIPDIAVSLTKAFEVQSLGNKLQITIKVDTK